METDSQMLASSPHAFANPTARPADIRPTKRSRTDAFRYQVSDSQAEGGLGNIWYANTSFGVGSNPTTTGQASYQVGSQYPTWPTEAASFEEFTHWSGVPGLGNCAPNSSPIDETPQTLLSEDATAVPSHDLWGVYQSSPVAEIGPGSLAYQWASSVPSSVTPTANQGIYNQPLAGPPVSCQEALLSTPPSFTDTALCSRVGAPLDTDNGLCPAAGEQSHSHAVPSNQSSYAPLTPGLIGHASLGSTAVARPGYDGDDLMPETLTEYCALPFFHRSAPYVTTAAITEAPGFELSASGNYATQQPDNKQRIKQEITTEGQWDKGHCMSAEVELNGPYTNTAEKSPRTSCDSSAKDVGTRKKRGRFDEALRRETSDTRSIGACLRCRNQRVRCKANKLSKDPLAPCETCLKVRKDSRKTIHNLPCVRYKVTSFAAFRPGGLGLTQRFDHTKVVNVLDYCDDVTYHIQITQGLCPQPLTLRVRRFKPQTTDVTHLRYVDRGIVKTKDLGAFCLADVERTAREFGEYLDRNAFNGLEMAVKASDSIVQDVFRMIRTHYLSLPVTIKSEDGKTTRDPRKYPDQKEFLHKLVRLWFAILHGTGSAWVCGKEHLGMKPGSKGIHRMIVAQFDSIRCERIYKNLMPDVLRSLDAFLATFNKEAWFTVFLATFLLLHQAACSSDDRYRHVRANEDANPRETRYGAMNHPLTAWIEELHHGAAMLLIRWQYFKRCDLMNLNWEDSDTEDFPLRFLEAGQVEFIRDIVGRLKDKLPLIPTTPAEGCWEHELFWVSKMFVSESSRKADWTPPEIFTRAKPSVGRG